MDLSSHRLSFLGAGYSFYFTCVKYCWAILFVLMIVPGWFNMAWNWEYGTVCTKDKTAPCYDNFFSLFTIGNS